MWASLPAQPDPASRQKGLSRLLGVVVDDLLEGVDLVVHVLLHDLIQVDLAAAVARGQDNDRGDRGGQQQDRDQGEQVASDCRGAPPSRGRLLAPSKVGWCIPMSHVCISAHYQNLDRRWLKKPIMIPANPTTP